jgi:hypothetical protein
MHEVFFSLHVLHVPPILYSLMCSPVYFLVNSKHVIFSILLLPYLNHVTLNFQTCCDVCYMQLLLRRRTTNRLTLKHHQLKAVPFHIFLSVNSELTPHNNITALITADTLMGLCE